PTQLPNRSPGIDIGGFFTAAGLLPAEDDGRGDMRSEEPSTKLHTSPASAVAERRLANERRTTAVAEELGTPVDELRPLMVAEPRQASQCDIVVRVKSLTIHRIIQSGRFKTEYELIGQRNTL